LVREYSDFAASTTLAPPMAGHVEACRDLPGPAEGWRDNDPLDADLIESATALVRERGRASVGMLQRGLRIGYNCAERLLRRLCERGVVEGPVWNVKPEEKANHGGTEGTEGTQEGGGK
jgi:DNA segregation ATPase FtsK/SpoIIIE-like protein